MHSDNRAVCRLAAGGVFVYSLVTQADFNAN